MKKILLLMALLLNVGVARCDEDVRVTRENALKEFEYSVKIVRDNINGNPADLTFFLNDMLAYPLGPDPRVIALCDEILLETNNQEIAISTLLILRTLATEASETGASEKTRQQIADVLRRTLQKPNFDLQYQAIHAMQNLGGDYREEAYGVLMNLLTTAGPDMPPSDYLSLVLDIDAYARKEPIEILKHAIQDHGLIALLEARIAEEKNPVSQKRLEKFRDRLRVISDSKDGQ